MNKQNQVYKQFADGKIQKRDLEKVVQKSEEEFNEFAFIRLKKIKIEKFIEKKDEDEEIRPMSIKERIALFESKSKLDTKPGF